MGYVLLLGVDCGEIWRDAKKARGIERGLSSHHPFFAGILIIIPLLCHHHHQVSTFVPIWPHSQIQILVINKFLRLSNNVHYKNNIYSFKIYNNYIFH